MSLQLLLWYASRGRKSNSARFALKVSIWCCVLPPSRSLCFWSNPARPANRLFLWLCSGPPLAFHSTSPWPLEQFGPFLSTSLLVSLAGHWLGRGTFFSRFPSRIGTLSMRFWPHSAPWSLFRSVEFESVGSFKLLLEADCSSLKWLSAFRRVVVSIVLILRTCAAWRFHRIHSFNWAFLWSFEPLRLRHPWCLVEYGVHRDGTSTRNSLHPSCLTSQSGSTQQAPSSPAVSDFRILACLTSQFDVTCQIWNLNSRPVGFQIGCTVPEYCFNNLLIRWQGCFHDLWPSG